MRVGRRLGARRRSKASRGWRVSFSTRRWVRLPSSWEPDVQINGRLIQMHHEASRAQLGGKAWALASAQRAGLPVPAWFVVPASACGDGEEISPDLRNALRAALEEVFPRGSMVAVRSSAVEEDGERLSFAGQLESHLFVRADRVPERVADVWRSAGTVRARAYRELHGNTGSLATAVLVQQMID